MKLNELKCIERITPVKWGEIWRTCSECSMESLICNSKEKCIECSENYYKNNEGSEKDDTLTDRRYLLSIQKNWNLNPKVH